MTVFFPRMLGMFLSTSTPSWSTRPEQVRAKLNREFRFVEYGQPFHGEEDTKDGRSRPAISCDGRIPGRGVTLELTHWNGNETPDDLYADTSTEMAIKLAINPSYDGTMYDALILNNHFDTDGVLSVWACLEPELATNRYHDLLIQGAEAGDFGEWSSDNGVKLDCALTEYCNTFDGGEGAAFESALQSLVPSLLEDLQSTGGRNYEQLWKVGFDHAVTSWEALQGGRDVHMESFNKDIAILTTTAGSHLPSVSPCAVHRWLKENGLEVSTKRIVYANLKEDNGLSSIHSLRYEKTGHGWVQKLVQRPSVPDANVEQLVRNINAVYGSNTWKKGNGMLGICQTTKELSTTTAEVVANLARYDDGLMY